MRDMKKYRGSKLCVECLRDHGSLECCVAEHREICSFCMVNYVDENCKCGGDDGSNDDEEVAL